MASDGKWYPPELHPNYAPARPAQPTIHHVTGLFRNAQDTLRVPAGGVVFREGDKGEEMFGIIEGQIELHTADRVIAVARVHERLHKSRTLSRAPSPRSGIARCA